MLETIFAQRLGEAMKLSKLKAAEVADSLGVTRPLISQYLSGRLKPSARLLKLLSELLNVTEDWLLGEVDSDTRPEPEPEPVEETELGDYEELILKVNRLDKRQQYLLNQRFRQLVTMDNATWKHIATFGELNSRGKSRVEAYADDMLLIYSVGK